MSKKQVQMRPYRVAEISDLPDAPAGELLAQFTIDTGNFDGVRLDVDLTADSGAATATLETWFLNRSTGVLTQDKEQTLVVDSPGFQTFKVETSGQPVYMRIAALTGTNPILLIAQGAYLDSKV